MIRYKPVAWLEKGNKLKQADLEITSIGSPFSEEKRVFRIAFKDEILLVDFDELINIVKSEERCQRKT